MQTLKTAVVVVLLLVVLYGFYIMVTRPEAQQAAGELAHELVPPNIEFGGGPPALGPVASSPSEDPLSTPRVEIGPASPGGASPAQLPQPTWMEGPATPDPTASRVSPIPAENPAPAPEPKSPPPPAPPSALGHLAFTKAIRDARSHIAAGRHREALFTLSIFYDSEDLTPQEHRELLDLLDPLAGRVVYSREHLLEPAYEVGREESLVDIAARYNVPWQLLKNINGVENPEVLVPGTKLKIVPGPFRAEVRLDRRELTVFVGRYYAGRFPISLGNDPVPSAGEFEVQDKRLDRAYFPPQGGTMAASDPTNPYGGVWIDLGREFCIHGTAERLTPGSSALGCISLSPRDARDVFGILSRGSKVTIRR